MPPAPRASPYDVLGCVWIKTKPTIDPVGTAAFGTNRTNRAGLMTSVDGGKPEVTGAWSERRE
jgi:hypothetical protein